MQLYNHETRHICDQMNFQQFMVRKEGCLPILPLQENEVVNSFSGTVTQYIIVSSTNN